MANNATKLASIKFYKAASLAEDLSRRIMTASARLQAARVNQDLLPFRYCSQQPFMFADQPQ